MKASASYAVGVTRCPRHPDEPRKRRADGRVDDCRPCRRARDVERNRDPKRQEAKRLRTQWVRTFEVWQRYLDQLGIPR